MITYYLQRCTVHPLPGRGLMRCYLQGVGHGWRGQSSRHEEFVNIPLREQEPMQETIRRAVFASPHAWKVSLWKNLSEFDGKFYQPVRERAHERDGTADGLASEQLEQTT